MSSCSRITDDEMKYYQFKARQQFLIKREDHDWNEFCKKNKCTCCSCQPFNPPTLQRDVGIQAAPKPSVKFNEITVAKRVQEKPRAKSLNEIESELEALKLTVTTLQQNCSKDGKEIIKNSAENNQLFGNELALNLLGEERQNLIRASLLNSLHRLHSSAAKKITKPLPSSSPQNKGFFLHPNLEKQRLLLRNAYLSSLKNKPKLIVKTNVKPLKNKGKTPTENNKKLPRKVTSKTRTNKVTTAVKLKEEETLIQLEAPTDKDENIEHVVDNIVDDLLGEEILSLNRIKYMKLQKQNPNIIKPKSTVSARKDIHLSQPSPETRAKIKKIPFFDFSSLKNASQSHPVDTNNEHKNTNYPTTVNFQNPCDQHNISQTLSTNDKGAQVNINELFSSKSFRTIHTDQILAKKVARQRKLFFQYLQRVSRNRSHNFDPVALSNMVAESLLIDCLSDVCEELDEVPTSLIADLYKQEFTSTL